MKKIIIIVILTIAAVLLIVASTDANKVFFAPRGEVPEGNEIIAEIVAENLEVPWEIVFLPESHGERVLVSERTGKISVFSRNWEREAEIELEAEARGEAGLLGMTIHPEFSENGWIYVYATLQRGVKMTNSVERYEFRNNSLENGRTIIEDIPGALYHDGGRLIFGEDGLLYIATGDATVSENAQNTQSLSGKILRLTDEGNIPESNPLKNEIFSYGHRNPQGLSFDDEGMLWSTEHGRSGLQSGFDEINLIRGGYNYGWPIIQGSEKKHSLVQPVLHSGSEVTWAPADVLWINGSLLIPGLRGESLYRAKIMDGEVTEIRSYLQGEYGRLRSITLGPDNSVYVSTSNSDGRGKERKNDDKIIKIDLDSFDWD